jgi:excinuclease ABC subunit A
VIDLGPEGGPAGGRIVAEGPPEVVATVEESFTGNFLRPMLNGRAAPSIPAVDPKPRRGRKARQA